MVKQKINKKKIVKKLSRETRIPPARIEVSKKEKQKRQRWSAAGKHLENLKDEGSSGRDI
jgi:hypothetical protein